MKDEYITIGQILKSIDKENKITRQGLYYYEEIGLISPAIVTERFRLYTKDTINKLNKIRKLARTNKLSAIKKMVEEDKL